MVILLPLLVQPLRALRESATFVRNLGTRELNAGDSKHGWKRKEFRSRSEPNEGEMIVHMSNGVTAKVESIGVVRLHLATCYVLDLLDTAYIPSIRKNLISVSILDRCSYTFQFGV